MIKSRNMRPMDPTTGQALHMHSLVHLCRVGTSVYHPCRAILMMLFTGSECLNYPPTISS